MTLVILGDEANEARVVRRVPQGQARREDVLRDLLFANPAMLPVSEIDPAIGPLIPIARELNVPDVGRIDAFLADGRGHLVIVECKLWRNPQARREVVGQILDYARALARFSYDDLQREVSGSTKRSGNALYDMVADQDGALDEARFVDQVSRNLAAGRFLLMVVGDGITEGTQRIGEYLVAQPGLAFDFALVEMAQYAWTDPDGAEHAIVQPRLLAKTAVIERAVIRNEASVTIEDLGDEAAAPATNEGAGRKLDTNTQRQWRAFAERFIASMAFDDPSQPPPRFGGLGWMKAALPRGHWMTLYRSTGTGNGGAYVNLVGSEGLAAYDRFLADRDTIDEEIVDAGLPKPEWARTEKGGSISLKWPSPQPWDETAEAAQIELLKRGANQLVNSFRPRLDRQGADI